MFIYNNFSARFSACASNYVFDKFLHRVFNFYNKFFNCNVTF